MQHNVALQKLPGHSKHAPIKLRRGTNADIPAIAELFRKGMFDNMYSLVLEAAQMHPLLSCLLCATVPACVAWMLGSYSWIIRVPLVLKSAMLVPVAAYLYTFRAMRRYVTSSLQDDLADIERFYSDTGAGPGSNFWVAEQEDAVTGRNKVIGMVALERKSAESAELRRMSVSSAVRKQGLGKLLAQALIAHAQQHGFRKVELTTSSAQYAALHLYRSLGWRDKITMRSSVFKLHTMELELPTADKIA